MFKTLHGLIEYWIPPTIRADADLHLKGQLLVQSGLLVLPMMIFYSIFYASVDNYWGAAYMLYGFVTACFMLLDFRRRGHFGFSGNFFCFTSYLIVTVFTLTTGGLENMIAPWIIMVPISGFMLVGIRAGIFWSSASLLMVISLFVLAAQNVLLPHFQSEAGMVYVNVFSLVGLIGYIVIILLNNDLGRMRMVSDLRKIKADVEFKNEEISQINMGLEAMVEARTTGLQAANDELDTFLYESSHALRRPLVRIIGLLSLIETECSPEEKATFMGLVNYTAYNMDAMLHDLLLVSEVYQHKLVKTDVHLRLEVDRILEKLTISNTIITLEIDSTLIIESDPEMVRILLQKVLDNGVSYRKEVGTHSLKIHAEKTNQKVVIAITDNGIGIDKAAIPSLYKMFARGTQRSKGSGLGLFIAYKALQRIGGNIVIESEKGAGTVVVLEFTRQDSA